MIVHISCNTRIPSTRCHMLPQLVSTGTCSRMAEKYLPFSIYLYIYKNFYFIIFLNIITFFNTYSRITIGLLCNNVMLFIIIKIINLKLFIKFSFFGLFFFKFIYWNKYNIWSVLPWNFTDVYVPVLFTVR